MNEGGVMLSDEEMSEARMILDKLTRLSTAMSEFLDSSERIRTEKI